MTRHETCKHGQSGACGRCDSLWNGIAMVHPNGTPCNPLQGWRLEQTGGNCTALTFYLPSGDNLIMVIPGGGRAPQDLEDDVIVGLEIADGTDTCDTVIPFANAHDAARYFYGRTESEIVNRFFHGGWGVCRVCQGGFDPASPRLCPSPRAGSNTVKGICHE